MDSDVKQFAKELVGELARAGAFGGARYGTKAPGTGPSFNFAHGSDGLFGVAGLEQDVISARITPRGISQVMPAYPSVYTSPEFAYITGIESTPNEDEPATPCATCPSGEMESCIQTAQFGFLCRETKTIDPNRAIERINRGEFDLTLLNDIIGRDDLFQPVRNWSRETILQVSTALGMLEVGVLLQNKLVPMVWQGNPANNNVGGGYKEFPGLDILIGTGKTDAHTNTACPALDSDVKDYNYQLVNATDAAGNFLIVRYLETMEAYLYHNADRQNLTPATWAICMRPELWYELTNIWPIAYMTTRNITLPTNNSLSIDASRVREMMDEMQSGMFLFLNGRRHVVIVDDGIAELNPADNANIQPGEFASDIYIVPTQYLGNRPATYFEFKDYRAAGADVALLQGKQDWWTDSGRFMWVLEQTKWCYTLSAKIEARVILKVPQLAGRLQHVLYSPLQHFRDWDENSSYFYKGGVSLRGTTELYSPWSSRQ